MAKKYVRFTQTKLRGDAILVQLQAVEFYATNGQKIKVKSVTNPDGSNPDGNVPENVIDGNSSTKWCDLSKGPLVFEFPSAKNIATYKLATANDCSERDPIRWKLEGSSDKKKWTILDDRSKVDYATPEARNKYTEALLTDYKKEQDKKSKKKTPAKGKGGSKRKTSTTRRPSSKRRR